MGVVRGLRRAGCEGGLCRLWWVALPQEHWSVAAKVTQVPKREFVTYRAASGSSFSTLMSGWFSEVSFRRARPQAGG